MYIVQMLVIKNVRKKKLSKKKTAKRISRGGFRKDERKDRIPKVGNLHTSQGAALPRGGFSSAPDPVYDC